jgi:hypothetical protein
MASLVSDPSATAGKGVTSAQWEGDFGYMDQPLVGLGSFLVKTHPYYTINPKGEMLDDVFYLALSTSGKCDKGMIFAAGVNTSDIRVDYHKLQDWLEGDMGNIILYKDSPHVFGIKGQGIYAKSLYTHVCTTFGEVENPTSIVLGVDSHTKSANNLSHLYRKLEEFHTEVRSIDEFGSHMAAHKGRYGELVYHENWEHYGQKLPEEKIVIKVVPTDNFIGPVAGPHTEQVTFSGLYEAPHAVDFFGGLMNLPVFSFIFGGMAACLQSEKLAPYASKVLEKVMLPYALAYGLKNGAEEGVMRMYDKISGAVKKKRE